MGVPEDISYTYILNILSMLSNAKTDSLTGQKGME